MHPRAVVRTELGVGDVAGQRMTKVDELAPSIAQPPRAQTHDRLVGVGPRELDDVDEGKRAARDGEPVDDRVLFGWKLVESIPEELLESGG